jgi:hypothetical protein
MNERSTISVVSESGVTLLEVTDYGPSLLSAGGLDLCVFPKEGADFSMRVGPRIGGLFSTGESSARYDYLGLAASVMVQGDHRPPAPVQREAEDSTDPLENLFEKPASLGGVGVEARVGMLSSSGKSAENIALISLGVTFDGHLLWPGTLFDKKQAAP